MNGKKRIENAENILKEISNENIEIIECKIFDDSITSIKKFFSDGDFRMAKKIYDIFLKKYEVKK